MMEAGLDGIRRHRSGIMLNRKGTRWSACWLLMLLLFGCSINPATGKKQFNLIDESQEIHLGSEATPEFLDSYGGELPSESIVRYVRDIGHRLVESSERRELPWEFHVVDSATVNAFALPGGKVFISRGLLELMDNEAQLAGVLGHEIGHVTAQHIGQQMSQAMIITGLGIAIGIVGEQTDEDWLSILGMGTSVGGSLYLLSFSRDQEAQADELGVRYMTRLGYHPMAQIQVMKILKQQSKSNGSKLTEMLSTHPLPETRIEHLESHIREAYPDSISPGSYRFEEQRFQRKVLDELKQLPPPAHKAGDTGSA